MEARDADLLQQANPFLAKLLATFLPGQGRGLGPLSAFSRPCGCACAYSGAYVMCAGDKVATSLASDLAEDVGDVEGALRWVPPAISLPPVCQQQWHQFWCLM